MNDRQHLPNSSQRRRDVLGDARILSLAYAAGPAGSDKFDTFARALLGRGEFEYLAALLHALSEFAVETLRRDIEVQYSSNDPVVLAGIINGLFDVSIRDLND